MHRTAVFLALIMIFPSAPVSGAEEAKMKISTAAFEHNGNIPSKYTCDGKNVNPPLRFEGVPKEAKSLALIMDDPDAPMGTFVHWVLWDIDPKAEGINENSVPHGASSGINDFRRHEWGGPCPPSGTHRYFFKLYALDSMIRLPEGAKKADLEKAMKGHIVAQSEIIGLYKRK